MTANNLNGAEPAGPVHGDAVRLILHEQEGVFLGSGPRSVGIRTTDGRLRRYRHAEIARIVVLPSASKTDPDPDGYEPDGAALDRMTRAQLAELHGPERAVADILDDWLRREHGVISSSHGVGMFLDLLAEAGYQIMPITADCSILPPTE